MSEEGHLNIWDGNKSEGSYTNRGESCAILPITEYKEYRIEELLSLVERIKELESKIQSIWNTVHIIGNDKLNKEIFDGFYKETQERIENLENHRSSTLIFLFGWILIQAIVMTFFR